ncbi:MAG: hypothetical protein NXI01_08260 [Gammaproteobacteria bacterium]|nr:hypothetical protein [Gammaproteobacteria bacterium]
MKSFFISSLLFLCLSSGQAYCDDLESAAHLKVTLRNVGAGPCVLKKAEFKSGALLTGQQIPTPLPADGSNHSFTMDTNMFSHKPLMSEIDLQYQCDIEEEQKFIKFSIKSGLDPAHDTVYDCPANGASDVKDEGELELKVIEQADVFATITKSVKPTYGRCIINPIQQGGSVTIELSH